LEDRDELGDVASRALQDAGRVHPTTPAGAVVQALRHNALQGLCAGRAIVALSNHSVTAPVRPRVDPALEHSGVSAVHLDGLAIRLYEELIVQRAAGTAGH
jgi:hypothetical protein